MKLQYCKSCKTKLQVILIITRDTKPVIKTMITMQWLQWSIKCHQYDLITGVPVLLGGNSHLAVRGTDRGGLICFSGLELSMLPGVWDRETSLPILLVVCGIAVNTAEHVCGCSPPWSDLRCRADPLSWSMCLRQTVLGATLTSSTSIHFFPPQ